MISKKRWVDVIQNCRTSTQKWINLLLFRINHVRILEFYSQIKDRFENIQSILESTVIRIVETGYCPT